MSLLLLEGDLLIGLAVGASVTSLWKIVKTQDFPFMGVVKWLWSLPSLEYRRRGP
jgi:hypothetical protein